MIPSAVVKIIQKFALITILISALGVLGNIINFWLSEVGAVIYLTDFFVFFRRLLMTMDTFIHVPTIILLIGVSFYLLVAYWTFRGVLFITSYFKND